MVPTFEYGDEILESVSNTFFFQVLFVILHSNILAGHFEVIRSTRGACGTFKGGALSRGPFT